MVTIQIILKMKTSIKVNTMTEVIIGQTVLITNYYYSWVDYSDCRGLASYQLDYGAVLVVEELSENGRTAICRHESNRLRIPTGVLSNMMDEQGEEMKQWGIPLAVGDILKFNKEIAEEQDVSSKLANSLAQISAIENNVVTLSIGNERYTHYNLPLDVALDMKSEYDPKLDISDAARNAARAIALQKQIEELQEELEEEVGNYFEQILEEEDESYEYAMNAEALNKLLYFTLPMLKIEQEWKSYMKDGQLCLECIDEVEYVVIPKSKIPKSIEMGDFYKDGMMLARKLVAYATRKIKDGEGVML